LLVSEEQKWNFPGVFSMDAKDSDPQKCRGRLGSLSHIVTEVNMLEEE